MAKRKAGCLQGLRHHGLLVPLNSAASSVGGASSSDVGTIRLMWPESPPPMPVSPLEPLEAGDTGGTGAAQLQVTKRAKCWPQGSMGQQLRATLALAGDQEQHSRSQGAGVNYWCGYMCANPSCWYLVSSDPALGGYCCKGCHWRRWNGSKTTITHGEMCTEAPIGAPRAGSVPPLDPLGGLSEAS